MAFSHRQFIRNASGRQAFNLNLAGVDVTRRSVALGSAAPCDLGDGSDPDVRLRVHGPDVWVSNIVPHGPEGGPGGIEYVITVAGAEPVDVAVTLTILEPWESFGFQ